MAHLLFCRCTQHGLNVARRTRPTGCVVKVYTLNCNIGTTLPCSGVQATLWRMSAMGVSPCQRGCLTVQGATYHETWALSWLVTTTHGIKHAQLGKQQQLPMCCRRHLVLRWILQDTSSCCSQGCLLKCCCCCMHMEPHRLAAPTMFHVRLLAALVWLTHHPPCERSPQFRHIFFRRLLHRRRRGTATRPQILSTCMQTHGRLHALVPHMTSLRTHKLLCGPCCVGHTYKYSYRYKGQAHCNMEIRKQRRATQGVLFFCSVMHFAITANNVSGTTGM